MTKEWIEDDEDNGEPYCLGEYACGSERCDFCIWEEICHELTYGKLERGTRC